MYTGAWVMIGKNTTKNGHGMFRKKKAKLELSVNSSHLIIKLMCFKMILISKRNVD